MTSSETQSDWMLANLPSATARLVIGSVISHSRRKVSSSAGTSIPIVRATSRMTSGGTAPFQVTMKLDFWQRLDIHP